MQRPIDPISYQAPQEPVLPSQPAKSARMGGRPVLRIAGWCAYALIGGYGLTLAAPYLPSASRYVRQAPDQDALTLPQTLALVPVPSAEPIPGPNRLSVPSMGVEGEIFESADESALDKGIWRRPNSSTPDKGGNTVLAAHRFKYLSGNNTFYNLDKVQLGDQISLVWQGRRYSYVVTANKVVERRTVSIEDPTPDPTLTLFTCTPLWTSEQRLVVVASLIGVE